MRSRILLALLAVAVATSAQAELVDRIVAIIDREVVTLSEAQQARAIAQARSGETVPLVEVVEQLIESHLVEREVERFSSEPVPMDLVDTAIENVRSGFATEEAFQQMLHATGLTDDELRQQLRRQLAISRYLERRFRALTFVTDEEVTAYYRDELPSQIGDEPLPELSQVSESIRLLLEERTFNRRVDEWIADLKARAHLRRYVW